MMAPTQELPLHLVTAGVNTSVSAQSRRRLKNWLYGDVLDNMAWVTWAVGEVGVAICGFGTDVRFQEAVF